MPSLDHSNLSGPTITKQDQKKMVSNCSSLLDTSFCKLETFDGEPYNNWKRKTSLNLQLVLTDPKPTIPEDGGELATLRPSMPSGRKMTTSAGC